MSSRTNNLTHSIPCPEDFAATPAYDLLSAASRGLIGIDQRWVHALVDDPERSFPGILRFASEDFSNARLNLQPDLIAIFRYLKKPEALPLLLDWVRADPGEIEDELIEAIADFGTAAVEPVLELCHEFQNTAHWQEIAFLLAGLGIRDARILDFLAASVDRDLQEGLFLLEVYGDPAAIPALERRAALTLQAEQRQEIEDTIRDLSEPRSFEDRPGFDLFDSYTEQAGPDFDLLSREERLELLEHSSAGVRAGAAESFFNEEELEPEERTKLLNLAQSDPDSQVRARSWEALLSETEDEQLRGIMLARLAHPDTPQAERAGLAVALSRHTDHNSVQDTILQLVNDPETRAKALEAMWRSRDGKFQSFGARYLSDPDLETRRAAIWLIGYSTATADAPKLVEFFDNPDLRADALHNYALAAPGETSRTKVRALLRKISDLARGLDEEEEELVQAGLDFRLALRGFEPAFDSPAVDETALPKTAKTGRNEPCPCGSGKKYKKCCGP